MWNKFKKIIKCFFYFFKYKIVYRNKINMNLINSFSGKFSLKLDKNSKCNIGKFLMIDGPVYIKALGDSEINIGDNCFFNHNCNICAMSTIDIGNNCMFAYNVTIIDHDHKVSEGKITQKEFNKKNIIIGNNVWCGANVVILKGVKIGNNCIIAAGAVVNKDIPDNEIWGEVPAKKIKNI